MSDKERIDQLERQLALVLKALQANVEIWDAFVDDWATCNPTFGSLEGYNSVSWGKLPVLKRTTYEATNAVRV